MRIGHISVIIDSYEQTHIHLLMVGFANSDMTGKTLLDVSPYIYETK